MTSIFIVDDHWLVREGLIRAMRSEIDLNVVGEAETIKETVTMLASNREMNAKSPDVIVLDAILGEESGIENIPFIKRTCRQSAVLVLSMLPENPHAVRAIEQGADGYITKGSPPSELKSAIRAVGSGQRYVTSHVAQLLAQRVGATISLSPRELEIVRYIALGYRGNEVARLLNLSFKTVSAHKANAMKKLNIDSHSGLIRWAIEHSLA